MGFHIIVFISIFLVYGSDIPRPLLEVMEELGEYAAAQGLTKEGLDDLLKDE
jgi:hypothetical protein